MFKYLSEHNDDVIAVMVTGKLEKADYDSLIPEIEEKIKRHGQLSLYWEMKDFEGWDFMGALQDLKLDVSHANDFKRVAMVGDVKWEETMTQLMKPFSKAEIRYFDISEAGAAKQWIQEK